MRAVILAAGEGQRLRPLTNDVPKPMLSIAGRPILEHNVRLLASHGITDIAINTHYRADAIVSHFGDGRSFGVRITYSHEERLRGTAGAVLALREFVSSPFMVIYGDNLSTCDLRALIALHSAKRASMTLAVYRRENATAGGIVSLDRDGRIVRFLEKPKAEEVFSPWVNAGIMVCESEIIANIPAGESDFGKDVLPVLLGKQRQLYGYRMNEPKEQVWWIDSPEDYERTNAALRSWTP
jgi:mannose-1-phosphate guanylyltransferase/phosphomannomutase